MKKYQCNFINLNNLKNKNPADIVEYLKYNGSSFFDMDDAEGLISLIGYIYECNRKGFVVSYMIDRICKEFDLLKIGDSTIINIEIKLSNRQDKLKQAKQNYYLLYNQYPEYEIIIYSYVKNGNRFFKYDHETDNLIESDNESLNNDLLKIKNVEIPNINIDIKNVYEKPDFFLKNKYLLSNSQENIKEKILNKNEGIYAISGSGGTGKSLLALDVYKTLSINNDICFLIPFAKSKIISHTLLEQIDFRMARYFPEENEKKDIVIIDEAQRIGYAHLNDIKKSCRYLIIFYDKDQDIDGVEQIENFLSEHKLEVETSAIKQIIRSDSTIDRYARKICGLKKSTVENKVFDPNKIDIYMRDEFEEKNISKEIYKLIEPAKSKIYTSSCESICPTKQCIQFKEKFNQDIIHFEIGKEYKQVLIYLCNGYCIKNNKIDKIMPLCYGNLQKQLYTIISRTIEKVVFVCDDIEVYNFLSKCKLDLDK